MVPHSLPSKEVESNSLLQPDHSSGPDYQARRQVIQVPATQDSHSLSVPGLLTFMLLTVLCSEAFHDGALPHLGGAWCLSVSRRPEPHNKGWISMRPSFPERAHPIILGHFISLTSLATNSGFPKPASRTQNHSILFILLVHMGLYRHANCPVSAHHVITTVLYLTAQTLTTLMLGQREGGLWRTTDSQGNVSAKKSKTPISPFHFDFQR